MVEKVVDLRGYRKAKAGYEKLLIDNPYTRLTFEDYFKVKTFLEKVQQAKLRKQQKKLGK